ncbi:MAG: alpha/beta fold hydrolase [Candidatus Hydrogenedentes bacterium]|nr:alpha/beta fold hydrolase [Candidatus Hydrogenedentota bacterium]
MKLLTAFGWAGLLVLTSAASADESGVLPLKGPSGFCSSGGEEIYFETYGSGEPVVLSHGLGGNHAIWYQQVPVLAQSYRVIVWDQRGFGRSTNHENKAGPAAFVEDLTALLDHLEIEIAHLIGQSMGGWTVMGFALSHPERVRSLVMADTIGGLYTPKIEADFDEYIRAMQSAPIPDAVPIGPHPALGEDVVKRDLAQAFLYSQIGSVAKPPPANVGFSLRATKYPHDALAKVNIPTLFIVGEHDPIFPPSTIREASSLIAASRVVEIPGAGHSPYFETPDAWNRVVLEFLGALSESE